MTTIQVTKLEKQVLEVLAKGMYAELGFSDMGYPELREDTGLTNKVLRGVVGSLSKKGLVSVDDRDGSWGIDSKDVDMHIIYLTEETLGLVEHWVGEEDYFNKTVVEKVLLVEAN
jgi:DNA-binding IclR family transcriptional regulator